jgi:hypothetical protein
VIHRSPSRFPSHDQIEKLPAFDLVVIDEAHDYYFVDEGMVKRIIKRCQVLIHTSNILEIRRSASARSYVSPLAMYG